MDFSLTDEQRLIIKTTREFVEQELYPHEALIENTGELPSALLQELKAKAIDAGLYAANMPVEVGGAGLDAVTCALYEKELGRTSYALHYSCVARPSNILLACQGDQRERFLLPAVRGERTECLAMTEPGAGSDLRSMKTSAVKSGADYVINGTKHFISHADQSDFVILFAASGEEDSTRVFSCVPVIKTYRIAGITTAFLNSATVACPHPRCSASCTRDSTWPTPGWARLGCRWPPPVLVAPNGRLSLPRSGQSIGFNSVKQSESFKG
jgi:alkylation response protein AidB-like acyl-CoA dehydrogenase